MKLIEFNKRMTHLFLHYWKVKMDISLHGSHSYLEINLIEDVSTPFELEVKTSVKFLALISLEERYGLTESNFTNAPEEIRGAVFETVMEFVTTPLDKRF